MMAFRIGVIGCGWIADQRHGPAYKKYKATHEDVELAACCDVDETRVGTFAKKYGFLHAYTDLDTMLHQEKLDTLCLLSPVQMTVSLAKRLLPLGCPLILEKPPGATRAETLELLSVAQATQTPHRVAFNRRYAPLIRTLRARIAEQSGPLSLQYDLFRVKRLDADFSTTAIHAVDAVRFLCGSDYERVEFVYRPYPGLDQSIAQVQMHCLMQSGASVEISICPVSGVLAERVTAQLPGQTLLLNLMGNTLTPQPELLCLCDGELIQAFHGDESGRAPFEQEGFDYENQSFFDAIRDREIPSGDILSCLQSVTIAQAIRERHDVYLFSKEENL